MKSMIKKILVLALEMDIPSLLVITAIKIMKVIAV